ncbi:hypothetical protein [Bradyrhizobium sp. LeoA1S1]
MQSYVVDDQRCARLHKSENQSAPRVCGRLNKTLNDVSEHAAELDSGFSCQRFEFGDGSSSMTKATVGHNDQEQPRQIHWTEIRNAPSPSFGERASFRGPLRKSARPARIKTETPRKRLDRFRADHDLTYVFGKDYLNGKKGAPAETGASCALMSTTTFVAI